MSSLFFKICAVRGMLRAKGGNRRREIGGCLGTSDLADGHVEHPELALTEEFEPVLAFMLNCRTGDGSIFRKIRPHHF